MDKKDRMAYATILSKESGYIRKDPGGRMRIALAYPNKYYVGMSNLGLHAMYRVFNSRPDTLCERIFLPSRDLEWIHRNHSIPLLSLESQTPVREFDILAFSCSFENDYLNCLKMMDMAGIPLRARERDGTYPIVVMGGACTFFNVEPMSPFMDCFICGEGEGVGNDFMDVFGRWLDAQESRDVLLRSLLHIDGIYCPEFYEYRYDDRGVICDLVIHDNAPEHIRPRIEHDINELNTSTAIFNEESEFGHMYLLEVTRGCPRGCHFCLLSRIYKPFRQRELQNLLKSAGEGLKKRRRVGLMGASLTDYRDIVELCEGILSMGGEVSLCSLRADDLSDRLMECLAKTGIRTITLAPEAGRECLRAVIGKGDMTDEKIMESVERLVKWGVPNLKLYFMVGIPGETEEDMAAIITLVKKIGHHTSQISKGKGALRQITISLSSFVPKPLTLFQYYPMQPVEILNKKIRYIAREARSIKGITCVNDLPKWSFIQALLSRGDRRAGEILHMAHLEKGNWSRAFSQLNINPEFYLNYPFKKGDMPPWGLWLKQKVL
ncbi:radical SAM protein [bacterium]|nr:radical SAM protein [bacterium]